VHRRLCIQFSPAPYAVEGTSASFRLTLRPQERTRLGVMLMVEESAQPAEAHPRAHALSDVDRIGYELQRSVDDWLGRQTRIESDSLLLNRVVERSQRDLRALRSSLDGYEYFAAGVPWFATLFGRDSLLTALQTLSCDPGPAESTLRLLALHQGREIDDYRDEQPGKILHEYRDGELARTGEIPHSPYYGTVDATPLFLVLLGRHAAWTGSLALFHELRDNVERALEWMARHGDEDGDGYIEYRSTSEKGLVNQGWKDSGDAIVEADGTLARPPIALVEVQGYAYQAKLAVAELFERAGEPERADALRGEAEQLRARFNRDFWLPELDFYALALQADARPCAVLSSNAGHALWSGIADPDKAGRTAERLMAEDLFSGWGIRTLSSRERAYNPVGYHRGTVWPHDNSLIAAGFRRYGFDAAACAIFSGLVQAAAHFAHQRLPELFAGFAQEDYGVPVRYPVACHPQAWAAGSLPFLIESLLGLRPEGFEHRLRIVRPVLPGFIDRLEVSGLRVGEGRVDLLFSRGRAGLRVEILGVQGDLEVRVEP
jgi:glycogen debranching enzyme